MNPQFKQIINSNQTVSSSQGTSSSFSMLSSFTNPPSIQVPVQGESKKLQELREIMKKTENPNQIVIKNKPRIRGMESQRGSKYRGVSKNGKKWQVSTNTQIFCVSWQFYI